LTQEELFTQDWFNFLLPNLRVEAIDFIENALNEQKGKRWEAEGRLLLEKEKSKKLYDACVHAFQWHCGTSSEQAEKDCMTKLQEAIESYVR